jgi:hypothetical protein
MKKKMLDGHPWMMMTIYIKTIFGKDAENYAETETIPLAPTYVIACAV